MTIVVAELGINHQGSLEWAKRMIEEAAVCGCDAVKVQNYRCAEFLEPGHPEWALFESCEIADHLGFLVDHAHRCGLEIGTTPASEQGVKEAVDAGVDYLKVGSDSMLHADLIDACIVTGLDVWVSTGMATEQEIESLPVGPYLMLCTSLYPCPADQANLGRLRWGLYDGFSDHTEGWLASTLAAGHGVKMVEKHFTLDKASEGPDQWFSADPADMTLLVDMVKKASVLCGSSEIEPTDDEWVHRDRWRVAEGKLRPA